MKTAAHMDVGRDDPQSGPHPSRRGVAGFFHYSLQWVHAEVGSIIGLSKSHYINREGEYADKYRLFEIEQTRARAGSGVSVSDYINRYGDGEHPELGHHILINRGLPASNGAQLARLLDAKERKKDRNYRQYGGRMPRVYCHGNISFRFGLSKQAAIDAMTEHAYLISVTLKVPLEARMHYVNGHPDHFHVLIGTRVVEHGKVGRKCRALDAVSEKCDGVALSIDGRLVGATLERLRAAWAQAMREASRDELIDHRSYRRRRLPIDPVTYVPRGNIEYQKRHHSDEWRRERCLELAMRAGAYGAPVRHDVHTETAKDGAEADAAERRRTARESVKRRLGEVEATVRASAKRRAALSQYEIDPLAEALGAAGLNPNASGLIVGALRRRHAARLPAEQAAEDDRHEAVRDGRNHGLPATAADASSTGDSVPPASEAGASKTASLAAGRQTNAGFVAIVAALVVLHRRQRASADRESALAAAGGISVAALKQAATERAAENNAPDPVAIEAALPPELQRLWRAWAEQDRTALAERHRTSRGHAPTAQPDEESPASSVATARAGADDAMRDKVDAPVAGPLASLRRAPSSGNPATRRYQTAPRAGVPASGEAQGRSSPPAADDKSRIGAERPSAPPSSLDARSATLPPERNVAHDPGSGAPHSSEVAAAIGLFIELWRARRLSRTRVVELAEIAGMDVGAFETAARAATDARDAQKGDPSPVPMPLYTRALRAAWSNEDNQARQARRAEAKRIANEQRSPSSADREPSELASTALDECDAGEEPSRPAPRAKPAAANLGTRGSTTERRQTDPEPRQPRPRPVSASTQTPEAPFYAAGPSAFEGSAALAQALYAAHAADVLNQAQAVGRSPPSPAKVDAFVAVRLHAAGHDMAEIAEILQVGFQTGEAEGRRERIYRAVKAAETPKTAARLASDRRFVAHARAIERRAEAALYRDLRKEALRQLARDLDAVWVERKMRADELARRHRRRLTLLRDMRWGARRVRRRNGLVLTILSLLVELTILKPMIERQETAAAADRRAVNDAAVAATAELKRVRQEWQAYVVGRVAAQKVAGAAGRAAPRPGRGDRETANAGQDAFKTPSRPTEQRPRADLAVRAETSPLERSVADPAETNRSGGQVSVAATSPVGTPSRPDAVAGATRRPSALELLSIRPTLATRATAEAPSRAVEPEERTSGALRSADRIAEASMESKTTPSGIVGATSSDGTGRQLVVDYALYLAAQGKWSTNRVRPLAAFINTTPDDLRTMVDETCRSRFGTESAGNIGREAAKRLNAASWRAVRAAGFDELLGVMKAIVADVRGTGTSSEDGPGGGGPGDIEPGRSRRDKGDRDVTD